MYDTRKTKQSNRKGRDTVLSIVYSCANALRIILLVETVKPTGTVAGYYIPRRAVLDLHSLNYEVACVIYYGLQGYVGLTIHNMSAQ